MTDLAVEKATHLDVDVCRALVLSSEPWITLGYGDRDIDAIVASVPNCNLWVARQGDTTLGFALSSPGMLLGEYLRIIAVDANVRARGVGRKLMDALEAHAFLTWPNVYLCVSDFNTVARQFYQRLGYVEVGLLPDLLLPGKGEVLMRKSIAAWRGFAPR